MIGAARRWLKRNRKGLAIGAGVLGAGYLAGQYVLSKISEARERMSSDRIARENLRRRFEQNQTDCTYTVIALLPTATENIVEALPVEDLTKELQKKRAERLARINAGEPAGSDMSSVSPSLPEDDRKSFASFQSEGYVHASQAQLGQSTEDGQARPKRNKTQLWNEVKITSITRAFTMIYTLALLNIFTRIQLNLLGRRNYLSSVISLAKPVSQSTISLEDHDDDITQTLGDDFNTNRRYLAFSWWLLHRGWKEVMGRVQPAVEEFFGPLNPREDISLDKLSELTLEIRKKVEGSTEAERRSTKWLSCLLPSTEEEDFVLRESGVEGVTDPSSAETASKLRHLLDETADLIDSPSFSFVLTLLLNEGFSTLVDVKCANEAFKPAAEPEVAPQSFDSVQTAHVIGHGPVGPNEYLTVMDRDVRELEAFSAVIYSSNFDLELLGATDKPENTEAPRATDADSDTSSAPVMLDKEVDVEASVDLAQTTPSIIEHGEGTPGMTLIEPEQQPQQEETAADSAFERAWGKAVDDGKPSEVEGHASP
ncbi:hypothetical protein N7470_003141 [Penicillium chermesinum]|nr:hypothetical protein N7470_003141 [Penicillium chermesinum]